MRRTPITYYGGKQQLVSTILPMIPNHSVYCEHYLGVKRKQELLIWNYELQNGLFDNI